MSKPHFFKIAIEWPRPLGPLQFRHEILHNPVYRRMMTIACQYSLGSIAYVDQPK